MQTVTPAGDGMTTFVLAIVFLILCWPIVVARVVVRCKINAFGLDDWLMCLGLIMMTAWTGPLFVYCLSGGGYQASEIPAHLQVRALKFYMICQSVYCPTIIPVKLSICVALFRIAGTKRRFRYAIYAIAVVSVISGLGAMIGIVVSCSPTSAFWNGPPEKCNNTVNAFAAYFISACSILTDWSLAILPAIMLWNVQLKRAIKITVAIILSMAAFASCATIVRLRFLLFLLSDKSIFLFGSAKIAYWTVLELGIGIFAGSLPTLRPLLSWLPGMASRSTEASGSAGYGNRYPKHNTSSSKRSFTIGMHTLKGERLDDKRSSIEDSDSQKNILSQVRENSRITKSTAVTVTRYGE